MPSSKQFSVTHSKPLCAKQCHQRVTAEVVQVLVGETPGSESAADWHLWGERGIPGAQSDLAALRCDILNSQANGRIRQSCQSVESPTRCPL